MSLTSALAAAVARKAQAYIRRAGTMSGLPQIMRWLKSEFPETKQSDGTWRTAASEAREVVRGGELLESGVADTLRPWEHGRDRSLAVRQSYYGYRVVVTVDDGTGQRFETAVTVTNSAPLDGQTIRSTAIEMVRNGRTENDYRTAIEGMSYDTTYSTRIIGAGVN